MDGFKNHKYIKWIVSLVVGVSVLTVYMWQTSSQQNSEYLNVATTQTTQQIVKNSQDEQFEKEALRRKFDELIAVNSDTIAYIYAPGTKLDEPIVQTTDNSTYLKRTFDGGYDPFMGTVFMDRRNGADFSNQLTWLFGHARGSVVPDNRMFNDVNFYVDQKYFDEHPYVVIQTPEKTHYYEAAFYIVVPERTAFYKTKFNNNEEFVNQLKEVRQLARVKNDNIDVSELDKYVVLSTCREEDPTIRANLYLREIPKEEVPLFLSKNKEKLTYKRTR